MLPNIKHSTYIKVKPEIIYQTLTTAQGWNAWFTDDTKLTWKEDGTGYLSLKWLGFGLENDTIEDGGAIVKAEQNKTFAFQWSPGDSITTVTFSLKKYRDGTLLELEEKGYTSSERDKLACIRCSAGWGEALTLLKMYLEHSIVCKKDIV